MFQIVYPIMMIAYALIEIKLLGANVPARKSENQ